MHRHSMSGENYHSISAQKAHTNSQLWWQKGDDLKFYFVATGPWQLSVS